MKNINVGVVGAGVVGSDVVRILTDSKNEILAKVGIALNVKGIYTRNPGGEKSKDLLEKYSELFVSSVEELYNDEDINIIVETIGGIDKANEIIQQSLKKGKSVVTANKDLIATNGLELYHLAKENHQALKFEAAVAGGIPIVNAVNSGIIGDEITEVRGIMNGTCNYILTKLENGGSYEEVLQEAQDLGYAESDPTNDVEGFDTAYKLAILMSIGFGKDISINDIDIEGISQLTSVEFKYAKLLEKKIKLLGVISSTRNKISAFVSPVLLDKDNKIAKTNGVLNAIDVVGKNARTFYSGPGAGGRATASAIVSDIINVAKITNENGTTSLEHRYDNNDIELVKKGDIESKFYCRFFIKDQKGILSSITSIFAKYGINIDQVLQHNHESDEKDNLAFVITLEKVAASKVKQAIEEIDNFDFINQPTFVLKNLD